MISLPLFRLGSHRLLQQLLDCHREAIQREFQQRDPQGSTLLHFLVQHRHIRKVKAIELVKLLVQHGVNPALTNSNGVRAMDLLPNKETMYKVLKERLPAAKKGEAARVP